MANSERFFMASPRYYIEQERNPVRDDVSDYRYHRDYTGRHSIADLSLMSYKEYGRERERAHSRSRSRSRSRSASRSRRSASRSHRSHRRKHKQRSRSSSSSSDAATSITSITTGPPPQFVTPTHDFQAAEKGDLTMAIGDIIEVKRFVDKNWYKGTNLKTHMKGIFPVAYVEEIEISSTKALAPLSADVRSSRRSDVLVVSEKETRRRAVSQPRIRREELIVSMPKETEKKGSFWYPDDTVLVRNHKDGKKPIGVREVPQEVTLIKPKDTLNHERAHITQPTVERDIYHVEAPRRRSVVADEIIVRNRRAIEAAPVEEEILVPIRRKEISLREVPAYSRAPETDVVSVRSRSVARARSVAREPVHEVIVERDLDEISGVSPGTRSVREIRVARSPSPQRRRSSIFKQAAPARTVTYNEYGAPIMVDTKTFAPAPAMQTPPRPQYAPKMLEPAPVPILPQEDVLRHHRVYQY